MPKNFPFYNPDHHRHIIGLLESKQPLAIIAATGRNPELAGALYPFPLIEDGDFDIPSVYMTEEEGRRLLGYAGKQVELEINARRIPATGCNVIARKGEAAAGRVVVCAHIDAKIGTPGAIDNAAGVTTLLLLAELLADDAGQLGVEIVAFNGEDYYGAPGQLDYLSRNAGKLKDIVLAINLDGVGFIEGNTAYSLYQCPAWVANLTHGAFSNRPDTIEGQPWYQSDHSIFIQNGVPAMALTSDRFDTLWTEIAHTPKDTPDIIDCNKLVNIARALQALIVTLGQVQPG